MHTSSRGCRKKAQEHGMKSLDVHVQGPGSEENLLYELCRNRMNVTSIRDVTLSLIIKEATKAATCQGIS